MSGIVIYGSKYGTARQYAEELARRTDLGLGRYDTIGDVNTYDTIVYIGALYAGGVVGMKKTFAFARLSGCEGKRIIIATVGLADPEDQQNTDHIKACMRRQLPGEVYEAAQVFHLRGGIDYTRLSFKHRTMIGLLYRKVKSLPEEEKTAEVRAMIDTYGKRVSFVDAKSLDPIIAVL